MGSTPTPRWSDPLAGVGDRFPLGPPADELTGREDPPSSRRPFSLAQTVAGPGVDNGAGVRVRFRYDHVRQVALVDDGQGDPVPLIKHTQPGATPPATTGSTDGQPGKAPPEETGQPDYQSD